MKNLCFQKLTRPCFIRVCVTLASNPGLLKFCTHHANDFANTANPVFIPVFLFFNKQWWRSGGGRGVKCERVESKFNQELTPIWPRPNPYTFWPITLLQKIHSRCWRSSSAKKLYTAIRTLRLWPVLMSTALQSHSMPKNSVSQAGLKHREGGEGEGGGCWKPNAFQEAGLWDSCWLRFAKNLEKFFEKS